MATPRRATVCANHMPGIIVCVLSLLMLVALAAASCDCDSEKMSVNYALRGIPDATTEAEVNISLDTENWEVVFQVRNVKALTNGHVIASPVRVRKAAHLAFPSLVDDFSNDTLWQPLACGLGGIDTPAADLHVRATWDNTTCRTTYETRYSLIDSSRQDRNCNLQDDGLGTIQVNCSLILSTVRAYALTEQWAYLAQETSFVGTINLESNLNSEVANALSATLAKCSVKNGPLYYVDCRIPGQWQFNPVFSLVQEPEGWIDASTCSSVSTSFATFISCSLNSSAPIADIQTARANLTATPNETDANPMTFDVEYIIPRRLTTFTSASLAAFVRGVDFVDGQYFYGTADKAVLQIDVFDSSRLTMTDVDFFNAASPRQSFPLLPPVADTRFRTLVNVRPERFLVEFYPASIRDDSRFYREGPHGMSVTFTFTAARRQGQESGEVRVDGMLVQDGGPPLAEEDTDTGAENPFGPVSRGTANVVGLAVMGVVVVAFVGLMSIGFLVASRRRQAAKSAATPRAVQL